MAGKRRNVALVADDGLTIIKRPGGDAPSAPGSAPSLRAPHQRRGPPVLDGRPLGPHEQTAMTQKPKPRPKSHVRLSRYATT